eukprot:SAG11_NODE_2975_length_2798_cov_1.751019_1_plen_189_part_00
MWNRTLLVWSDRCTALLSIAPSLPNFVPHRLTTTRPAPPHGASGYGPARRLGRALARPLRGAAAVQVVGQRRRRRADHRNEELLPPTRRVRLLAQWRSGAVVQWYSGAALFGAHTRCAQALRYPPPVLCLPPPRPACSAGIVPPVAFLTPLCTCPIFEPAAHRTRPGATLAHRFWRDFKPLRVRSAIR